MKSLTDKPKPARCNHCGSTDLQAPAWVDLNTKEIYDWTPDGNPFCARCEGDVVALYDGDCGYDEVEALDLKRDIEDEVGRQYKLTFGVDGEWNVWGPKGFITDFVNADTALEKIKELVAQAVKDECARRGMVDKARLRAAALQAREWAEEARNLGDPELDMLMDDQDQVWNDFCDAGFEVTDLPRFSEVAKGTFDQLLDYAAGEAEKLL